MITTITITIIAIVIMAVMKGLVSAAKKRESVDPSLLTKLSLLSATKKQESVDAGFVTKLSLLSTAEKDFHNVLHTAIPHLKIFPKIRVADVIEARNGAYANFLKISQKHFDWVICETNTLKPIAVIELDDSSHATSTSRQRDQTKNSACESAALPLIRFVCRSKYDITKVRRAIDDALTQNLS